MLSVGRVNVSSFYTFLHLYFIRLNLHWQINHIYDTHKYILFYLTNIWIEKKLIKKYKDTFCPLTNFDFC